jgi:hypothetical protein
LKTIKFVPYKGFEGLLAPTPIKNHVPDWYKDSEMHDFSGAPGLKKCIPFLDSMLSGYALTIWEDIEIFQDSNSFKIQDNSIINERISEIGSKIPIPDEYMSNHFVWSGKWGMQVPQGYSVLITHPINRLDLPFLTLSGIIDSDTWIPPGNIPFFLKKGFSGVIPKGTPFAHVFPYKREVWSMEIDSAFNPDDFFYDIKDGSIEGYYKKKFWERKRYT